MGFSNLKNANPEVDPWLLPQGETILLPYACILPVDAIAGLTINLAELRLYHLWKNEQGWQVRIYPVGIGSEGSETPLGDFSVLSKRENPIWTVPDSVRKTQPELPESVPPGPDNPRGQFWLGFASNGYGIHGTNKPFGIGRRVSHGCLRTYPEDIR
ncbi:MAG: L,D-transpeptidase family protein, partial [Desulfuromonadaceae bacterium]